MPSGPPERGSGLPTPQAELSHLVLTHHVLTDRDLPVLTVKLQLGPATPEVLRVRAAQQPAQGLARPLPGLQ